MLARNYPAEAAERVVRVCLLGGPQPLLLLLVQDRLGVEGFSPVNQAELKRPLFPSSLADSQRVCSSSRQTHGQRRQAADLLLNPGWSDRFRSPAPPTYGRTR